MLEAVRSKYLQSLLPLLLFTVFYNSGLSASELFPHRKAFPDVKVIEIDELYQKKNQCLIIDVRSKVEYNVIHISGSTNISITNKNFNALVEHTHKKQPLDCIVFYCNGHSCKKSYKAVKKMKQSKVKNIVKAFDAGIFSWADRYNNQTILFNKKLTDKKKLIDKKEYNERLINMSKLKNKNYYIIDIRDYDQRKEEKIPLKKVKRIPLSRILPLLKRKFIKDENLLFIDKVGKQNQWLQYYLKEYGYKNYAFLKGGSFAFR